jgi:hypothetical protein
VALTCEEQGKVAKPREAKAAMAAGKAPPPIVQHVVVLLGANLECHELVGGRAGRWLASRDQVGSWSPDGVLDDVGDEEGEDHADEPPQDGDVCFVRAGTDNDSPEHQDAERHCAGIDEEPYCTTAAMSALAMFLVSGLNGHGDTHTHRDALNLGVWVSNGKIVQKEHAVKGLGEELDLRLCRQSIDSSSGAYVSMQELSSPEYSQ